MLDQDQTTSISRVSSLHVMWQDLIGLSAIQRTRLNRNDLKPDVSSESLIEDLNVDPTVTPNLPYKLRCSSTL